MDSKTLGTVVSVIMFVVAALFLGCGALFLLSAFSAQAADPGGRLCIGGVLVIIALAGVAGGIFLVARARMADQKVVIEQKIDLTGDIESKGLTCQQCGAPLDSNSVSITGGAVFVKCPYCGANYQIIEEPK
ncbi:MAG: hypothetical protein KJ734_01430, partial [Chloroflexi bacterium]|nr:hypothetical protein [Chloroflexota bacterium]